MKRPKAMVMSDIKHARNEEIDLYAYRKVIDIWTRLRNRFPKGSQMRRFCNRCVHQLKPRMRTTEMRYNLIVERLLMTDRILLKKIYY